MVSTVQEKPAPSGKPDRAPSVLLLPSHLFFARSIDLPAGIDPGEVPSFVELSLEEISPFAINQLYYGYYLPENGSRLLVYAAYRKQLEVYEDDDWTAAELVLPDFTAALGISRKGPTLAFVQDEEELTAIYWADDERVPDRVISRRIEPVDGELPVERTQEALRRKLGAISQNATTLWLKQPLGKIKDRNLVFELLQDGKSEKTVAEIERPLYLPMDLRDKAFLSATRKMQRQNRWLWSGVLMACAGFVALGIFEAALFAGSYILETREERILALEPEVAQIMEEEELANRLAELSGERLLPFEMLEFLNQFRPPSIYYTRTVTDGLRSFEVEARTPRSQDVERFQRELENSDAFDEVDVEGLRLRAQDGVSSFTLVGRFREGALTNDSAPAEENEPLSDAPADEGPEGETEAGLPEPLPAGETEEAVPRDDDDGESGRGGDETAGSGEAGELLPDVPVEDDGAPADEASEGETQEVETGTPFPEVPRNQEAPAGGDGEEETSEEAGT